MSQLHLFLNTLTDPDKKNLGDLNLRGKEKEVYDYTLKFLHKEFPESDIVAKELQVSKTHLYKLYSVLLSKCYAQLFKEDTFSLLEFLKQKGLYVLMRSEAKTSEQGFTKTANKSEKELFYLRLFHLFIDVSYKFFDKKLILEYGTKYLKEKTNSSISDKLYVENHLLFADCNRCAALKNPAKAFGLNEQDLLNKEKKLHGTQHYLAQYYLFRTFISYYTFYHKDPTKIKPYLEKCLTLKDHIQYFFPIDIGQFLNLMYADRFFAEQEIEEAHKWFKREFDKGVSEKMYGYYYHCEQYVLLCMIKKDWSTAEDILENVFAPLIELRADIMATRGCLTYIKLSLLKNDFKQAMHYLHIASEINEKATYLPFEIQLRLLETLCFYKKADFDFCEKLAARNLKFVAAQNDKILLEDYLNLYKILGMFCKAHIKGKAVNSSDKEQMQAYAKKYLNLYCDLLRVE